MIGEFTVQEDLCGKWTQCLIDPCTCDELTNCNICNEGDSGGCSQCDHKDLDYETICVNIIKIETYIMQARLCVVASNWIC